MEGEPLSAVVRTLHLLIDRMEEQDMLTVIQYSQDASVIVNCATMTLSSKTDIHRIIDRLSAQGGTNIEAAITALGSVNIATAPIDAVFLMTDGFINIGITSSVGLLRLLSARLPNGTPVNTLGFGTSHNAEMLRDMAVKSRGSYTYADSTELIPAIIGDIIGGLDDQIGRNAVVTVTGGRCIELGIDELHPEVYRVGQLIADKPQWVLFNSSTLPVKLTWTEGGNEIQCEVTVTGALDRMDMEEQLQRVRLVETMSSVAIMIRNREYNRAIDTLLAHAHSLTLSPAAGRPFIIRLQAQVDEMVEDIRQQSILDIDDLRMVTRMVSNTTALGTQHGFFLSRNTTAQDPDVILSPFSTAHQRTASASITQRFNDPT